MRIDELAADGVRAVCEGCTFVSENGIFYPKSNNSYFQKGVIMADKKFDKINSVEALEAKLVEIRAAEEVWATFPQEKVDAICESSSNGS